MTNLGVPETCTWNDPMHELSIGEAQVRVSIWWIRFTRPEPRHKFLYGCIVPGRGPTGTNWTVTDLVGDDASFDDGPDENGRGKTSKRRIVRRTITVQGKQAFALLTALVDGKSLSIASSEAGVAPPGINDDLPLMNATWAQLPNVYFATAPSLLGLHDYCKGRASLTEDAGCYCARFVPPSRFDFLKDEIQSDDVLRWVAATLKSDSGIEFSDSAGDAFGCFEVFLFPSLDEACRCRLSVRFKDVTDQSKCVASFALSRVDANSEYLLQIRTEVLFSVTSDKVAFVDPQTGRVEVDLPMPLDGVIVRVWRRCASGEWMLWHEQEQHFIREIHTNLNMMGLSGTVSAQWLENLGRSREKSRAQAFSKIAQISMSQPSIISRRIPWEQKIQDARAAVRRVHPEISEGRFFGEGWEGAQNQKLNLAFWMKERLSTHSGNVVLLDPYFDLPGLDLIARASGAAKEIIVLTCTQVPSDDDKTDTRTTRPQRLIKASEELMPILQGLRLRVLDLKSKKGGDKQLFHDRYLLFYDTDGRIEKGFNLSTSLQSATRTSPLLVTPIPTDLLDEISDYVGMLLHPEVGNIEAEVVQLVPTSNSVSNRYSMRISPCRARSVLRFVEVLQNRTGLADPDERALLRNLGYIDGEDEEKVRVSWTGEQLETVRLFLTSNSALEGAPVWDGLVEASLAGWYGGIPDPLDTICRERQCPMSSFLLEYLLLHGKGELRAEDVGQHVRTLGHVFNTSFPKALENAAVFFDYHHEHPVGTSWGIHCALICLIRYFPDCVDKLIDSLVPIGQNSQGVLSGLAAALTVAVRNLDEDSQMLAFVQSRSTFMRALAGVAKWRTVQNGSADWNDFKSHLERYNLSERQEFLSRALFDLRIKANQAKGRGLELDQPLLPKVFDAILSGFADGASIERMLELMPNYSGPINGSWAASTHNEILRELVRRGVLAGDAPFRIWQEILWEKCEKNFYADTDLELIQVWGATYWDATEGLQCAVLQDANKLLLRAEKTLYDPFLHSRNYDRWRAAADIVLWWMIRLWAIIQKRPPAREPSDLESIVQFVTRLVDGEELVQSAIGELQHYSSIVLEKLRSPDTVA